MKSCLTTLALLEMLEEEDDRVTKRGKTRHWIKLRGEKSNFFLLSTFVFLQYLHSDQRYQRMLQQLKDMRAQGVGTTGAGK